MGTCVVLILLAWNVVRLWSTTAAVVMSVVAAVIPPVAAMIGNLGALDESQDGSNDDSDPIGSNRGELPVGAAVRRARRHFDGWGTLTWQSTLGFAPR